MPVAVNAHHCGGADKLPANTVYVGRPGPYGNPFSSASGLYTKEECVALHRISLYRALRTDSSLLSQLQQTLGGKDLACWCVQPKRVVACHARNYLHVLSLPNRVYDKPPVNYLMADLRLVLEALDHRVSKNISGEHFLHFYTHFGDLRLTAQYVLILSKERRTEPDELAHVLANVVIDLELSVKDPDLKMVYYRWHHAYWHLDRFIKHRTDKDNEPLSPHLPILKKVTA